MVAISFREDGRDDALYLLRRLRVCVLSTFVTLLISGISVGAIIAVVALGFLILFKATGVVNFAHGDLMTLAAYLAVWAGTSLSLPVLPAYGVALVGVAIAGLVLERLVFAPLRGKSLNVMLVATLGAALVIQAALALWQGSDPKALAGPVGTGVVRIAGASVAWQRVLVIVTGAAAIVVSILVFERTQFGRQVRALAADREAAMLQGIRVRRVGMIAFIASAVFAGIGGLLITPLTSVTLTFGFNIMLSAFAAAILGGFGNLAGTAAAAVGLGLVQQLVGGYVLTEYSVVLPYVVILLAVVLRPQGLLGMTRQSRV